MFVLNSVNQARLQNITHLQDFFFFHFVIKKKIINMGMIESVNFFLNIQKWE